MVAKQTKLRGQYDALKGHIFDCMDSCQANIFTEMLKEVSEYVGQEYDQGGDT